jgi:hypothetical protein
MPSETSGTATAYRWSSSRSLSRQPTARFYDMRSVSIIAAFSPASSSSSLPPVSLSRSAGFVVPSPAVGSDAPQLPLPHRTHNRDNTTMNQVPQQCNLAPKVRHVFQYRFPFPHDLTQGMAAGRVNCCGGELRALRAHHPAWRVCKRLAIRSDWLTLMLACSPNGLLLIA